ncbi:hypothetical protein [Halalkalicoccus salilacus]|uniref:hypothetical protein n=1 Tax=Halalkalicoccus sp. GCM10025704 TaxID=3252662 RepID=UPI0036F28A76
MDLDQRERLFADRDYRLQLDSNAVDGLDHAAELELVRVDVDFDGNAHSVHLRVMGKLPRPYTKAWP